MRYSEFNTITEGGLSSGVRYNSEVALLHSFAGAKPFDPTDIAGSFDPAKLENPDLVFKGIEKFLVPNYNEKIFSGWGALGKKYQSHISSKLSSMPTKFGWVAGANAGPVADVEFIGNECSGVSVKDAGGITLRNLTPKALGIEGEYGLDVFAFHAQEQYNKMKTAIFTDVMALAKANPDKRMAPLNEKYAITYLSKEDRYRCEGKTTVEMTEEELLNSVGKNAKWQRVFGDWFQANWSSKKQYAGPLYSSIAKTFEKVIEDSLQDRDKLVSTLAFEDQSYFYATPKSLYFVPSVKDLGDIKIKSIKYGDADGTSQKYLAEIGLPGSKENAAIIIYIRYANGMFETNPTVRIQGLRNPEHIGWQKLV